MPMYDWLFGTVAPESAALFIQAQAGNGPANLRRLTLASHHQAECENSMSV